MHNIKILLSCKKNTSTTVRYHNFYRDEIIRRVRPSLLWLASVYKQQPILAPDDYARLENWFVDFLLTGQSVDQLNKIVTPRLTTTRSNLLLQSALHNAIYNDNKGVFNITPSELSIFLVDSITYHARIGYKRTLAGISRKIQHFHKIRVSIERELLIRMDEELKKKLSSTTNYYLPTHFSHSIII